MSRNIDYNRSKLAVFASYISPHRGAFALDMCLSLAVALVDLAFPYVTRHSMNTLLRQKQFAAFFSVMTVVAMAGLWELVEWQYAVIDGGDAGAAFLGSQGDIWDAQKDILCDTLGAVCAVAIFVAKDVRKERVNS